MKLNVEWYVEYPYEVYQHQDKAQGNAQLGPFLAGYAQLSGGDDIGDVAGDEHASGDQKAHEHCLNLNWTHFGADLSRGQSGVIQNGGDHIHPINILNIPIEKTNNNNNVPLPNVSAPISVEKHQQFFFFFLQFLFFTLFILFTFCTLNRIFIFRTAKTLEHNQTIPVKSC